MVEGMGAVQFSGLKEASKTTDIANHYLYITKMHLIFSISIENPDSLQSTTF